MRLKNAVMVFVALLASGATTSFAQESHIGNLQGRASAGKALYRRYCIGCHGPQGDGAGENAAWVDPKPRDFTVATFKSRSTPSGTLPTDQDLYAAITRGFVNTSMPSWKPLTNQNRADLVAYVKTFSAKWKTATPGASIAIPAEPPVKIEGILHGRELFQKMECWKCHGPEGHGNGPAAGTLTDSKDNPIRPYNFAMGSRFKCGVSNEDLYRIFMTGLDGTPMPSFSDVFKPEEAWDLVHFLRTLQPMQTKEAEVWKQWRVSQPSMAKQLKPIGPEEAAVQGAMKAQSYIRERFRKETRMRTQRILFLVPLIALCLTMASTAQGAGIVGGKVTIEGVPSIAKTINMSSEPGCAKMYSTPPKSEDLVVGQGGALENVVVYISAGAPDESSTPSQPVSVVQKGCRFAPHVVAMQTGQPVQMVNEDSTSHNIHPLAVNNREWNKAEPPGTSPLTESFARPEFISVKCNVHPWMHAYFAVLKTSHYAVTGDNGAFSLNNLPPGKYTITAWHETLGTQTQEVTITGSETVPVNFVFKR